MQTRLVLTHLYKANRLAFCEKFLISGAYFSLSCHIRIQNTRFWGDSRPNSIETKWLLCGQVSLER